MRITKKYNWWNTLHLKKLLAGYMSRVRHTILLDFILVAQRLEQLGFTYHKGKILVRNEC